jgi:hypothetical protein
MRRLVLSIAMAALVAPAGAAAQICPRSPDALPAFVKSLTLKLEGPEERGWDGSKRHKSMYEGGPPVFGTTPSATQVLFSGKRPISLRFAVPFAEGFDYERALREGAGLPGTVVCTAVATCTWTSAQKPSAERLYTIELTREGIYVVAGCGYIQIRKETFTTREQ